MLGRAAKLTPGGLRAAIARAVMEVAPDKARKRREEAVRDTRVERWAEDSGNAALAGRELPPADVLAADQKITWWAKELRKAGLAGDMDELRARAFLDILLDVDSRPERPGPDTATGTKSGRKGQAEARAKGQAEARAKGQAEGQAEARAKGQAEGQAEAGAKGQAEGERTDGEPSNRTASGMDSSGTAPAAAGPGAGQDGPGGVGSGPEGPGGSVTPGPGRTRTGAIPPGFVGRVT